MKYPVTKKFRDKFTKVRYTVGDIYETDDIARATFLQSHGAIGEGEKPPEPKVEPVHLGGGWYQLADGRKVRKADLPGGD